MKTGNYSMPRGWAFDSGTGKLSHPGGYLTSWFRRDFETGQWQATDTAGGIPEAVREALAEGFKVESAPCLFIAEDLSVEAANVIRAFRGTLASDSMSPLVGYCSPGGSFCQVGACVADAVRRAPGLPVYRYHCKGNITLIQSA